MMEKKPEKKGLGRGLSALMSDVNLGPASEAAPRRPDARLPVARLRPNPLQPRKDFEPEALQALADSIRQKDVIQPLIVRPAGEDYEIVASERRWRAAQLAQVHDVPVVIRDLDDTEVLEIAIIENIQRADLNAVDEAAGYRQLMDRFGHTQEQLATALGKSRSHIANLLRLLTLPEGVQSMVSDGTLSAGHARTLVGRDDALALARKMAMDGVSVRAAERLVKEPARSPRRADAASRAKDPDTLQIEQELSAALGMSVNIDHAPGGEGGKLTLRYRSLEQLDDLLRALSGG